MVGLVLVLGCARSPGVTGGNPAAGGVRHARVVQQGDTLEGDQPGGQDDALVAEQSGDQGIDEAADYDPWQPFNERMFAFNHDVLDRYLVKPAAKGWEKVFPAFARRSLSRLFDNLEMPRRFVNNLLQARPVGAGRELARFTVNSTVGVGGLIDVATPLHIEPSDADAGETLALYGVGAGPYLVLPTMPPLTVRDAIGRGIDGALDPVSYVLPFIANRAKSIVTAINERSLNLKTFADVEDSVLDLYSAARNGYLQRRRRAIELAAQSRHKEWAWAEREPDHVEPVDSQQNETASSPRFENPT